MAEPAQAQSLIPLLKWAGGKRWLVARYSELLPSDFNTYIEPFLGAASVYFFLRPQVALLGDLNSELINVYRAIREDWQSVYRCLEDSQRRHMDDADGYYYHLRGQQPCGLVEQASRLIYLNRTCFNGIYRVNRNGRFNVPRGAKTKVVCETDNFEYMSCLLKHAELVAGDFESLVDRSEQGDFLFCDPPYTVRHNHNGFCKYNEVLFSWSDQERLARALLRAVKRGVKLLCTNADHSSVRDLYRAPAFQLRSVSRYSSISAAGASRRYFEELIIRANI